MKYIKISIMLMTIMKIVKTVTNICDCSKDRSSSAFVPISIIKIYVMWPAWLDLCLIKSNSVCHDGRGHELGLFMMNFDIRNLCICVLVTLPIIIYYIVVCDKNNKSDKRGSAEKADDDEDRDVIIESDSCGYLNNKNYKCGNVCAYGRIPCKCGDSSLDIGSQYCCLGQSGTCTHINETNAGTIVW